MKTEDDARLVERKGSRCTILIINRHGAHRLIVGNRGSEAVILSATSLLRQTVPEASCVTLMHVPSGLERRYCESTAMGPVYRYRFFSIGTTCECIGDFVRVLIWKAIRKRWEGACITQANPRLQAYSRADIVVHLGMDLYASKMGNPSLLEHSLEMLTCMALGKPVVMLSESVGPFDRGLARCIAGYVLRRVSAVMVRERISFNYLVRDLGLNKARVSVVSDSAFVFQAADTMRRGEMLRAIRAETATRRVSLCVPDPFQWGATKTNGRRPLVERVFGIAVYVLPERVLAAIVRLGRRTGFLSSLDRRYMRFKRDMIEIASFMATTADATVLIFSHVDEPHHLFDWAELLAEIADEVAGDGRIRVVLPGYSASELKALIGACELHVGGKMHANIAALSQCVPTVALASGFKFRGIMESVGQQDYVCEGGVVSEVKAAIERIWGNRAVIARQLGEGLPEILSQVNYSGTVVRNTLIEYRNNRMSTKE